MKKYKLKPNHDKKGGFGQHCGIDFQFGLNEVIIFLQKNQVHKVNVLYFRIQFEPVHFGTTVIFFLLRSNMTNCISIFLWDFIPTEL